MKQLIIYAAVFGLAASFLTPFVPDNNCPQPTVANPDPPAYYYADPDDCTKFFTCAHGKAHPQTCVPGTRWNQWQSACIGDLFLDTCKINSAERECSLGPSNKLIPHPTVCQRYYNCSEKYANLWYKFSLRPYEDECTYPELFDVVEKRCKPFKEANCGPHRVAAKDACKYLRNICKGHCPPCKYTYPSCVGKSDGKHENPNYQQWISLYIECDSERIIRRGSCGTHEPSRSPGYFSPLTQTCVSLWEVPRSTGYGLAPTCHDKYEGMYRSDERPDIYYSCPSATVFYCPAGTAFDVSMQMCQ